MSRYLLPDLVVSAQRMLNTIYRHRGSEYADEDSISNTHISSQDNKIIITAQLYGSDTYDTSITINTDKKLVGHDCSCPAHEGRRGCKHVAGLVRYIADDEQRSTTVTIRASGGGINRHTSQQHNIIDVEITASNELSNQQANISQRDHYTGLIAKKSNEQLIDLINELVPYLHNTHVSYTDGIKMLIVILVERPKILSYTQKTYPFVDQLLHKLVGKYIDVNTIFWQRKRKTESITLENIPAYISQMGMLQGFNTSDRGDSEVSSRQTSEDQHTYSVRLMPVHHYSHTDMSLGIYQHKTLKSGKASVGKLIKETSIRSHRATIPLTLQPIVALSSYGIYKEYHQMTFGDVGSAMIEIVRSIDELRNAQGTQVIQGYHDHVELSISLHPHSSTEYGDNVRIIGTLTSAGSSIVLAKDTPLCISHYQGHYALTDFDTIAYFFQSVYSTELTTQLISTHGITVSAAEFTQFRQQAGFAQMIEHLHDDGQLIDTISVKPKVYLTLEYHDDYASLTSQLVYSYSPDAVLTDPVCCVTGAQSKQFITLLDGRIIRRDRDQEQKLAQQYESLLAHYDSYDPSTDGYHHSLSGEDQSKTQELFAHIDEVIRQGLIIHYLQPTKKVLKAKPKASISISSGVDWLNASLEIQRGDDAQGQEDLIWKAISSGKREILLDDGTLVQLEQDMTQLSQQLDQRGLSKPGQTKRIARSQLTSMDDSDQCRFVFDKKTLSLRKQLLEFDHIKHYPLPSGLQATLRPYQYDGYRWLSFLYEYGFGGILADDMGLGKTIQTIALLVKIYTEDKATTPSLIVCPTSLTYNWQQEIAKFAPDLRTHWIQSGDEIIDSNTNHKGSQPHIYIISYGVLNNFVQGVDQQWHCLICDEAQAFKNLHSQRAKTLSQIQASYQLALSGTPIENNLSELRSIFHIVSPGLLDSYRKFAAQWIKNESSDLTVLSKMIKPFVLRRTKEQVLHDLPPKIEEVIYLEMETEQAALYHKLETQYKKDIYEKLEEDGLNRARFGILDALLKLRQACLMPALIPGLKDSCTQSAKLSYLSESVEELIQGGHTALLFSQFTGFLSYVREILDNMGIGYLYLDGSTPAAQRKKLVEEFNTGQVKVFIISLKAGGTGLNLVAADYVIHLDPWRNPAVEQQASDRAHRIGQTKTVFVQKLIIKNSIEEKILQLQERKKHLIDDIFSHDFSGSLDADDIKFILQ